MGAASGLAARCGDLQRRAEVLLAQQNALARDAKTKRLPS